MKYFMDYSPNCNYILNIENFAQIWKLCGDKGPEYWSKLFSKIIFYISYASVK